MKFFAKILVLSCLLWLLCLGGCHMKEAKPVIDLDKHGATPAQAQKEPPTNGAETSPIQKGPKPESDKLPSKITIYRADGTMFVTIQDEAAIVDMLGAFLSSNAAPERQAAAYFFDTQTGIAFSLSEDGTYFEIGDGLDLSAESPAVTGVTGSGDLDSSLLQDVMLTARGWIFSEYCDRTEKLASENPRLCLGDVLFLYSLFHSDYEATSSTGGTAAYTIENGNDNWTLNRSWDKPSLYYFSDSQAYSAHISKKDEQRILQMFQEVMRLQTATLTEGDEDVARKVAMDYYNIIVLPQPIQSITRMNDFEKYSPFIPPGVEPGPVVAFEVMLLDGEAPRKILLYKLQDETFTVINEGY